MRFAWSWGILPVLLLTTILILGAARPFERVPAGDDTYTQLELLETQELLGDYTVPVGELSRLEAAVLVQSALEAYGESLLAGTAANADIEAALAGLGEEFGNELAQIGVKANMPTQAAPAAPASSEVMELAGRVNYLEDELATYEEAVTNLPRSCEKCEEPHVDPCDNAVDVQLYGDVYIQAQGSTTEVLVDGADSEDASDIDIYWGEIGIDASQGDWSGHFSVLLDDDDDGDVVTNEAYIRYDDPYDDWYVQVGRSILPFGNNAYYFPTYPAVNDLGFTTADSVGVGYDNGSFGVSGWVFNPSVDIVGDEDEISDYSVVVDLLKREADECNIGYQLTGGYTSHLGTHDIALAGGGPLADRTAAFNVFGRLDWGGNRFHLLADYTAAMDSFEAFDLDTVVLAGEDVPEGDQPSALNVEFVYEPKTDMLYGVSYQVTDEMVDYAETRYGAMFGRRLSDIVMMKLEYTHGEYGDYVTGFQDTDDTFVAELNISF